MEIRKKNITAKQLESGLENLKKGPQAVSENAIREKENEISPYNFANFYASTEKILNSQIPTQEIEQKPKKKKIAPTQAIEGKPKTKNTHSEKITFLESQLIETQKELSELIRLGTKKNDTQEVKQNNTEIKNTITPQKKNDIAKFLELKKLKRI